MQGCPALAACQRRVSASGEKFAGYLHFVIPCSPVKRRRPLIVVGIWIVSCSEAATDSISVTDLDRCVQGVRWSLLELGAHATDLSAESGKIFIGDFPDFPSFHNVVIVGQNIAKPDDFLHRQNTVSNLRSDLMKSVCCLTDDDELTFNRADCFCIVFEGIVIEIANE